MKVALNHPYRPSQLGLDDLDGVFWGLFVGGCIDERSSWTVWEGARSHAHNNHKNDFFGWICILAPKDVFTPSGKMTSTLAHEVAHLMVPDQGHSPRWKRAVTELGFASEIARCHLAPL